ncbi:MAG TPA: 4'-phosphopantetheinyl transferase superfamily protein [Thermoanaerobaculia bacterium]|jgi:4'-phosphopantetheinyl transferase|nr:4'-phosphopantetheinyl transferase superfamily protein [Thermoanaerobaculia bacterium]
MIVIDVFFIDVTAPGDVIETLAESLTEAERARADRYHFADDRRRSIVARAAARRLLGRYLDADPRGLVFVEEEYGKPALLHRRIEFNASHSGDLVALAFANGTPVGIDVERRRRLSDSLALARRYFSAEELAFITAANDTDEAFFTVWTAKEAIVKANGKGIGSGDLRGFTVPFGESELKPVIGGWSVAAIEPPLAGYYSAVAARAGEVRGVITRAIDAAALL